MSQMVCKPENSKPEAESRPRNGTGVNTAGAIVALVAVAAISAFPNPVQARIHVIDSRAAVTESNTIGAVAAVVAAARSILINGVGQPAAILPSSVTTVTIQSNQSCAFAHASNDFICPSQTLSERLLDLPPPTC